ncbi:MAG: LamG-like jellyroll fold domain-containing protein [Phycisphaerales bacterium]
MSGNTTYYWRINEKNSTGTTTGDVWHFTTGTSNGMTGWWKFDDGSGITATDSSTSDNDGEMTNMDSNSCWVSGNIGSYALDFDGSNDYVWLEPDYRLNLGTGDFSFSMWAKKESTGTRKFLWSQRIDGSNWFNMEWTDADIIQVYGKLANVELLNVKSKTKLAADTWYLITVVVDRNSAANTKVYINNVDDTYGTPITADGEDLSLNVGVSIGRWSGGSYYFDDILDDFRLCDWVLDAGERSEFYQEGADNKAIFCSPATGSATVDVNSVLVWSIGKNAVSHDVYFGTASPGTFRGNQATNSYNSGTLSSNTTYYWRIDEIDVNDVTTTGDAFTTE